MFGLFISLAFSLSVCLCICCLVLSLMSLITGCCVSVYVVSSCRQCHSSVVAPFPLLSLVSLRISLNVVSSRLLSPRSNLTTPVSSHPFSLLSPCSPGVLMATQIGSFATLLPLMVLRHQVPTNYVLLSLFSLCMAFLVGSAAALYTASSVLLAVLLTAAVVGSLGLFTLQTKRDFTFASSGMLSALTLLLCLSLVVVRLGWATCTRVLVGEESRDPTDAERRKAMLSTTLFSCVPTPLSCSLPCMRRCSFRQPAPSRWPTLPLAHCSSGG